MARIHLIALLSILICTNSWGQVNKHAIGVRAGGGNFGAGGEISYQLGLTEKNRLEFDLGWRGNHSNWNGYENGNKYNIFVFSVMYHWVWNITEGLNWYIGPGAQVASWHNKKYNNESGTYIGIGGQIGLEYDFSHLEVPLLLSLDARPMGFFSGYSSFGYGGAFSLRYVIN